ncbi:RNA-directed DNA polymerase, eukaryota [Tanacetum coccineum]
MWAKTQQLLSHRNEGFQGVETKYLGGLWVMFEFKDKNVRDKFLIHEGILSWFSMLNIWNDKFVVAERLIWLEVEGVPFGAWNNDSFKKICSRWGEVLFVDDTDSTNRFSIRLCLKSTHASLIFASIVATFKGVSHVIRVRELCSWTPNFNLDDMINEDEESVGTHNDNNDGDSLEDVEEESVEDLLANENKGEQENREHIQQEDNVDSEKVNESDPFDLASLIAKRTAACNNVKGSTTLKYPPGFTQTEEGELKEDLSDVCKPLEQDGDSEGSNKYDGFSMQSSQTKDSEVPKKYVGISILKQMEDTIKVGTALGFNMEGCQDTLTKIIADMGDERMRLKWGRSGGCWLPTGLDFMFITVYAPQSAAGKIDLWASLSRLIASWDGNVIVMGDFNEVREAGERYGSVFHERQADAFNSFIENLNLIDIPLGGFRYTWSDKWASKMSKLDRFLVNEGVQDAFPHITGIVLEKGVPDHRPILIKEAVVDYGPTPFRFFHSWLDVEGFHKLVVDTWNTYDSMEANGMVSFKKKLQNLKQVIRTWNATKKSFNNQLRKEHQALLSSIDVKVDQGSATTEDINARVSSMKVLSDIDKKEASDLAQKAKIKWAIEGDENTSFFHGVLKKKRRQIAIKGVLKNGGWIEEPGEVKKEFYDHFSNRFASTGGPRPCSGELFFNRLSPDQRDYLESDFSNEEIKRAVWDCGGDRAPGPDGFTFTFFKTFWDTIQPDVVRFVREFFQSGYFPKGCNSSFIALIPKVGDAKFVSEFRPISLIGCQYKIIGKLLANRLSRVIGSCVSVEQSAFIKGRNILDGPLILNECMAWYRKRKKELLVFKVDFEKAFDSLRWDYLDVIMENLGFGSKWRTWIDGCLKNSRASVLVNGSPTVEFEIFRGLRQGDPLSPFLFILAMEGLHASIRKAVDVGIFKGASIGQGNLVLSHLFYAYDAIFVGEWSQSNVYNLICMLRCFYLVSGLKINVNKSKLLGVGVSDADVVDMAEVLGCGVSKLPMMYLGVPVGARLLSVGGRLTLLKSVVGNLPTYYMSLYLMPATVRKKLEAMRNKFFLGGDLGDRKVSWIKWSTCLASKAMGGLGIGSIYALNVALLFKWIWHFRCNPNDLWVKVVKDLHGCDGGIGTCRRLTSQQSTWNAILNSVAKLKDKGVDLLAACNRSIGDGTSTSFWNEIWCGDLPLKASFPRIYALDTDKECMVAHPLLEAIRDVLITDNQDAWKWALNSKGFNVASARIHIDEHTLVGGFTSTRWTRCVPIKVNVFMWRLSLDKLPTLVNLDRKGIDVASLLCLVCCECVENVNHLFFSCGMSRDLWTRLARWCDFNIPEISHLSEWISWLDDCQVTKKARFILEGIGLQCYGRYGNFTTN